MCGTAILSSLEWASKQTHVAIAIKASKPQAVCDGTHFDSKHVRAQLKLPLLIASVHTALLLMQCACQDEGAMQPQYTKAYNYIIIHIGWSFIVIRT